MSLTPVSRALASILADVSYQPSIETLPLLGLPRRVLAESISSTVNIPLWDNSAMDGYALSMADYEPNKAFSVSQKIYAGQYGAPLAPNTLARIFTGAPLPESADTVVMQEDTVIETDQVVITAAPRHGQHVRRCGEDIAKGAPLYTVGAELKVADLSVLASVGVAHASVFKKLKVAVFSTGSELIEPGQPLKAGQIYNSNRVLLAGLLTEYGCDVTDAGVVPDDLAATERVLQDIAPKVDLVVSTGGVSVGEADFLKAALENVGHIQIWKMAIKPGKPLVYGRVGDTPYFGLPGNPSSAFVTFQVIVKPYLKAMLGLDPSLETVFAKTDFAWPKAGRRQEYLRVQLYSDACEQRLRLHPNQSSGAVSSFAWANALAIVPSGAAFERGCVLEVLLLS